jgi:hypothetical protein
MVRIHRGGPTRPESITVRIDCDGEKIAEYENEHLAKRPGIVADVGSVCIAHRAGDPFQMELNFDSKFKAGQAEGVMVVVAIGHDDASPDAFEHIQAQWINKERLAEYPFVWINDMKFWDKGTFPEDYPLRIPDPVGKYMVGHRGPYD